MQKTNHSLFIVAIATFMVMVSGCSKDKSAQRAAANKAADAYCDCVAKAVKLPAEQRKGAQCEAENTAWEAAWKKVPGGAEDDDKAAAIFDAAHKCYVMLHEAP